MLDPKASGAFIAEHARYVRVNPTGVENVAKLVVEAIKDGSILSTGFTASSELHPRAKDLKDKAALNWCIFANSINFSFWTDGENDKKSSFTITYKGKAYSGWYGCCAAINRAIDNGIPLTDPEYVRNLTFEQTKSIFSGDDGTTFPLLAERRANLIETAEVLLNKFDGNYANAVEQSGYNAGKLLRIIVDNFPSFRDCAEYNGRQVSIWKRAQVAVADTNGCIKDCLPASVDFGMEALSMFADYRVPQVLAYFEAIEYSLELKDALRKHQLIPNGDPREVEIRGCSIQAMELIVEAVKKLLNDEEKAKKVTAATADYFLWCYRRKKAEEVGSIPFHRTRCIYY